jgi:hypothetical protein
MRRKLHVLALMSLLVIGGLVATSGPTSAGDGFARYQQQQARDRKKAQLRDQGLSRNRSSAPKSAGAPSKAGAAWRSIRPGTASTTR